MVPLIERKRALARLLRSATPDWRNTSVNSAPAPLLYADQIGDPTLADGILDRLVHNAHHIEMRGDSMGKNREKANT